MSGSFFGFNVAVSGLFAAQRNLDVVNHNMNNVNTPGYSRQYGVQQAGKPMALFNGTGMLGTGAEVNSVARIRDEFLDYKYWSENKSYGEWAAKKELMSELEVTFNEPSVNAQTGSGFSKIMNDYYDILQELSKNPSDLSIRAAVREKTVTMTKYFNSLAENFEKMQSDVNHRINTKVNEVNTLASQIADLNKQVYTAELDGSVANDLRDQRSVLVDKLSKIVDIQASEVIVGKLPSGKENKQFVVTIGGKALVDHYRVTELETVQRTTKVNDCDIEKLYDIQWEDGNKADISGGELKGYLDVRDGNNGVTGTSSIKSPDYKGIPYYMDQLNKFVQKFAMAVNEGFVDVDGDGNISGAAEDLKGHADGYGLDPDGDGAGLPSTGIRLFTYVDSSTGNAVSSSAFIGAAATSADKMAQYSNITAKNFSVSLDVLNDLNSIAASDYAPTATQSQQTENSNIIKNIIEMRHNTGMFAEGAPEDFMKALVVNVGIDSQQASRINGSQDTIVKQIESQRTSISGVNIDEELSSMIKFQQSYNACAKMISTMAQIYDTLIHKTGV